MVGVNQMLAVLPCYTCAGKACLGLVHAIGRPTQPLVRGW